MSRERDVTEHPVGSAEVREAVERLSGARDALATRSWGELAAALGAVGARFIESGDELRRAALERLPVEAGITAPMAESVLDGMAADWTTERLRRLVAEEFVDPACLDGPASVGARRLMAFGPALCVQIVSGSVPGVGVNALLRSLLLKSPTLIKPGRGDVVLTELFARALREDDPQLGAGLEVLYWRGDDAAPTRAAVRAADVVTVYGSDATVAEVRASAPPTTRVVGYHHREGVAVIGREVLTPETIDGVASQTARAVALFEQRGCVCPHAVYVEEGGEVGPGAFAEHLSQALRNLEANLPSPALRPEEGAAIQQLRGTAELAAATGEGAVYHGGADASWTVVYEERPVPGAPLTLGRAARVRALLDVEELPAALEPYGRHLQSVGYAGLGGRVDRLAAALGRVGASRLVPLSRVSFPAPWWLHDGRGPLSELVRWVEVER